MMVPAVGPPVPVSDIPERAFAEEISDELIAPEAFTSNRKFVAVVDWPERAFTLLISLELTDRVSFTSPRSNPIEADAFTAVPFTVGNETVTRLLFATVGSETETSFPDGVGVVVTATIASSMADIGPTELTVALN